MVNFTKAQAALEFLTTYGWAFLVILIMISTLAYFGILNPSKILPDRCNIGSEFECIDFQISATANTFKIKLKNSVGEPIAVSAITLSSESSTSYICADPPTASPISWTAGIGIGEWTSGKVEDLTWSGCNSVNAGIVAGEKGKVLLNIKYYAVTSGSAYTHEVNGEVYSSVT